jgi:hypothetical protein
MPELVLVCATLALWTVFVLWLPATIGMMPKSIKGLTPDITGTVWQSQSMPGITYHVHFQWPNDELLVGIQDETGKTIGFYSGIGHSEFLAIFQGRANVSAT